MKPDIKLPLYFPCTVPIYDNQVFLFGKQNYPKSTFLHSFLVDMETGKSTNLTEAIPCEVKNSTKFTCARVNEVIIIGMDECIPIFNLVNLTWSSILPPVERGIVFNPDDKYDRVIFIEQNIGGNESKVYEVNKKYSGLRLS